MESTNTSANPGPGSGISGGLRPQSLAEREAQVMRQFNKLFEIDTHASEEASEWLARFDDIDIDTASREEFVGLMETAPTAAMFTLIVGKFQMRLAIASVTDREFV